MDKILDKLKKAELFLLDNYRSKKPKSAKAKQLRQEQLDKRKKKNRHVNVYVSVKGKFILSKVVNRICQDYGFQKVVVLYRTEATKMEFEANFAENPEICCYCLS